MPDSQEHEDTRTRIKLSSIEKDMTQIVSLFHKLDATIDKLSDVSASIKQMIAIHEVRLAQQDKVNEQTRIDFREVYDEVEKVKTRVSSLENWRWWGAGIVTVISLGVTWVISIFKHLN